MRSQPDLSRELVAFLRDYAAKRINSRLFDARRGIPPYVVLDFGNRGLFGMRAPAEYGGLALSWRDAIPVMEQLAAVDLSIAMLVGIHNGLGVAPLAICGSKEAREELLPALASGRMLGGFAITETVAGSDPRGIKGSAEPLPDGRWRLNAEKIWVGNGSWAGMINVFVRRSSNGRRAGFAGFAVKTDRPGVSVGAEAMTLGMRGIVQNRMSFTDVDIEPEYELDLQGPTETMFHLARLGLAILSCGASKRCAQLMLRYAGRRSISTGLLADNPAFRYALSSVMHSVRAMDRLCGWIGERLDAGDTVPLEMFIVCKAAAPEYLGEAADRLVQFLGGRGYIESNEAAQLLRDARLLRIAEGPTETMHSHLGSIWHAGAPELRKLLGRPGEGAAILQRIETACADIAAVTGGGLQAFARYSAAGEVVAAGVMWWLCATRAPEPGLARWAEWRFEDARVRALRLAGTQDSMDASTLRAELENAIGDVVQHMPGEDWSLDPLLDRMP